MKLARLAEIRSLADQHEGKGSKCVEMLVECVAEIERLQRRRDAARGPSLSEVMTYAEEIGLNSGEPEKFFDHFTARGWKMGRTASAPMRDFEAAMRTWKRNCAEQKQGIGGKYGIG